ncbi:hypothetical protein BV22DRAFT_1107664 [Leucogyrophana mollusca]|uniref:Uncharacterized protein n=1 Tax=Leucogyrophana mollusca TaxID=85980 RepID=A0ACB8B5C6_9AGAM|nr:hypothetical protein BV22DRAFT_1107664 [Leucogyrophana mollusca]
MAGYSGREYAHFGELRVKSEGRKDARSGDVHIQLLNGRSWGKIERANPPPEYNSTLILRSETISTALPPAQSQHLPGLHPHSNVHRKLLPRRPGRDAVPEQHCTLYAYDEGEFAGSPCTLVLTPLAEKESLPYCHPAISHLAFRYIPSCLSPTALRIEVIPLPNTPTDPTSRLTTYQDMYLLMCERYKRPVDGRRGVTDPLKHVFEVHAENGLLTHILTAEGYSGRGIDLRARTSWGYYPPSTQRALHVGLTPWLPILTTTTCASGYLSIPCCAWSFDERYSRSRSGESYPSAGGASSLAGDDAGEHSGLAEHSFIASRSLGGDGTHKSSYPMYRILLRHPSEWLGWRVEYETLKIASTRNWALVGRTRTGDPDLALGRAQAIIAGVIQHG